MKRLVFLLALSAIFVFTIPALSGTAFVSPPPNPNPECFDNCAAMFALCILEGWMPPLEYEKHNTEVHSKCCTRFDACRARCNSMEAELIKPTSISTPSNGKIVIESVPTFIIQRRWPILSSVNPGNTNCTYFTDGTRFCR